MDDVAILEDGVELLFESRQAQDELNERVRSEAALAWAEFSGRIHPGRWTSRGVVFEYTGWYVRLDERDRWYLYRQCQTCRAWDFYSTDSHSYEYSRYPTQIKEFSELYDAYNSVLCWKRKCRKAREGK